MAQLAVANAAIAGPGLRLFERKRMTAVELYVGDPRAHPFEHPRAIPVYLSSTRAGHEQYRHRELRESSHAGSITPAPSRRRHAAR